MISADERRGTLTYKATILMTTCSDANGMANTCRPLGLMFDEYSCFVGRWCFSGSIWCIHFGSTLFLTPAYRELCCSSEIITYVDALQVLPCATLRVFQLSSNICIYDERYSRNTYQRQWGEGSHEMGICRRWTAKDMSDNHEECY